MESLTNATLSNSLLAAALAVVALAVSRLLKNKPAVAQVLWLLVLVKLVTPPVFSVPVSWSETHLSAGQVTPADSMPVVGVEISMLEAVVSFVWADAAGNELLLDTDGSQPSSFSRDQKLWPTKDGWVIAAPVSDHDVAAICKGVGVTGYDAPEVATIMARRQNADAFADLLRRVLEAISQLTTREAMDGMERERAPCGAVVAPSELHEDPQVKFLGMLEESVHPAAGRLRQPRPPVRFGATPTQTGAPAPTNGQNSDEILRELGRQKEIDSLRSAGIVA